MDRISGANSHWQDRTIHIIRVDTHSYKLINCSNFENHYILISLCPILQFVSNVNILRPLATESSSNVWAQPCSPSPGS